jgi:hypothetical protein
MWHDKFDTGWGIVEGRASDSQAFLPTFIGWHPSFMSM